MEEYTHLYQGQRARETHHTIHPFLDWITDDDGEVLKNLNIYQALEDFCIDLDARRKIVEENNKPTSYEKREWNHYFEVGDKVVLAKDLPRGTKIFNSHETRIFSPSVFDPDSFATIIERSLLRNKVGVILECNSDLHAFGRGNAYRCTIEFPDKIKGESYTKLTTSTQNFIKTEL